MHHAFRVGQTIGHKPVPGYRCLNSQCVTCYQGIFRSNAPLTHRRFRLVNPLQERIYTSHLALLCGHLRVTLGFARTDVALLTRRTRSKPDQADQSCCQQQMYLYISSEWCQTGFNPYAGRLERRNQSEPHAPNRNLAKTSWVNPIPVPSSWLSDRQLWVGSGPTNPTVAGHLPRANVPERSGRKLPTRPRIDPERQALLARNP